MAYFSTRAIVLRRANYRENDRILSLLTPMRGRVDVTARGCRRPKSPLLAACELFTLGEFVLYKGKGHEVLTACQIEDSFYPIRTDFDKLSYGAILLSAAEMVAQPEQEQQHLLTLLTRSLDRLAYGEHDANAVTAAYLLHLASLSGYKPRLNHCAQCGVVLAPGEGAWLSPDAGGLTCRACHRDHADARHMRGDSIDWLRSVLTLGIEKTDIALAQYPAEAMKHYVEQALERRLPSLPDYVAKL